MSYEDQPGSLCILRSRKPRQQSEYAPARYVAAINDKNAGHPITTVQSCAGMRLFNEILRESAAYRKTCYDQIKDKHDVMIL